MEKQLKDDFLRRWNEFFPGVELPLICYYTDQTTIGENKLTGRGHRCLIADLNAVRKGKALRFSSKSIGCSGGRRYLGFSTALRPHFEHFLSCGLPGKVEGERYKQTPELVREVLKNWPEFQAPEPYIVFKRWEQIDDQEEPVVVMFFANPDVLSGLYTLAGFDELNENSVVAPFGAGCASLVFHPYLERTFRRPRAFLGMFDPSARPYLPPQVLSFAVPMKKFVRMVGNMEESFLITETWEKMKKRINLEQKNTK